MLQTIPTNALRKICDVLGDTNRGLTGSEIGRLLDDVDIEDVEPSITKRERLFEALSRRQKRDKVGNNVGAFIEAAMDPVRYAGSDEVFEERRFELNRALSFLGIAVGTDGRLREATKADTLDEATQIARRFRGELLRRKVHVEVLRYCSEELLHEDLFHAILEAVKGLSERVRKLSGLTTDGRKAVR